MGPDGLCVVQVSSSIAQLAEPFVALHPTDSDGITIGVNAGYSSLQRGCLGIEPRWVSLLTSHDNGTSWRLDCTPLGEVADGSYVRADPAFGFTSKGVLQGSFLAVGGVPQQKIIHYVPYDWSVKSFGTPEIVSPDQESNDRNWLAVAGDDTVLITWRNTTAGSTPAVWSEPPTPPMAPWAYAEAAPCGGIASPAAFLNDLAYVACSNGKTYRLNTTAGSFALAGDFGGSASRPMMTTLPDGKLAFGYSSNKFRVGSVDTTTADVVWGPELEAATTLISDWTGTRLYAFGADPWGGLHFIIMKGSERYHIAVNSAGTLLAEHVLTLGETCEEAPDLYARKDDFGSIAFRDSPHQYGLLVWARKGCIDYTMIRPQW